MAISWVTLWNEVADELEHQVEIWGDQKHHPERWISIIGEEYGEVARAVVDCNVSGYRTELIHTAATAIAAVYCLDTHDLCLSERETKLMEKIAKLQADIARLTKPRRLIGKVVSVSDRPDLVIDEESYG